MLRPFLFLSFVSFLLGNSVYITYHDYSPQTSLDDCACSDGAHGLERWGIRDISSLYPYVTSYDKAAWNSVNCGQCLKVTASNGNSIFLTVIDQCGHSSPFDAHFDSSYDAFYQLFGEKGRSAGHGIATYAIANPCNCHGNRDCRQEDLEEDQEYFGKVNVEEKGVMETLIEYVKSFFMGN